MLITPFLFAEVPVTPTVVVGTVTPLAMLAEVPERPNGIGLGAQRVAQRASIIYSPATKPIGLEPTQVQNNGFAP